MIFTEHFGYYKNKEVTLYVLKNEFLEVGVTDFGAILQRFVVKTPNGDIDISCSLTNCDDYVKSDAHMGGTIGRVANRIKNAQFSLNGQTYYLDKNKGNATLHSGFNPFDYRFFKTKIKGDKVVFSLLSPDGDQGFPGALYFSVEFSLDKNCLKILFNGLSEVDTVFCPTNHVYLNLNGEGSGNIYNTLVNINGDKITLTDDNLVVNGDLKEVAGTPFDFLVPKTIAPDIFSDDRDIVLAGGFDHNYVLNSNHAATCVGDKTGICLDLFTDYPGLQFYCGNSIKSIKGKSLYEKHDAFCLEPQYFPNAINIEGFQKPIINAGEKVSHYIDYVITLR